MVFFHYISEYRREVFLRVRSSGGGEKLEKKNSFRYFGEKKTVQLVICNCKNKKASSPLHARASPKPGSSHPHSARWWERSSRLRAHGGLWALRLLKLLRRRHGWRGKALGWHAEIGRWEGHSRGQGWHLATTRAGAAWGWERREWHAAAGHWSCVDGARGGIDQLGVFV